MTTDDTPTPRTDAEFAHFPLGGSTRTARIEKARDFARTLERELAAKERKMELAQRDAGLYAGTLKLSASQLGCDEHMVDHEVKRLLKQLAAKEAELAAANWLLSKVNTAAWDALKAENATLRQRVQAAEGLAGCVRDHMPVIRAANIEARHLVAALKAFRATEGRAG